MKIIDLTLTLTHHMSVYPGDPEVEIVEIHQLAKEGWNLRQLTLTTHLGTHLNVPYHMVADGKKLDDYSLDAFMGPAKIYHDGVEYDERTGLIFSTRNIDAEIAHILLDKKPKFVGLSSEFEFDLEIEKLLLQHGIVSFENLTNTDQLPALGTFEFYGVPLAIVGSDGSPVRAWARVEG